MCVSLSLFSASIPHEWEVIKYTCARARTQALACTKAFSVLGRVPSALSLCANKKRFVIIFFARRSKAL